MKLMLLPIKLIALPIMLLLLICSLLGKAVTNISAYVVGLFMLVVFLIGVYCLWQHRWTDLAIMVVIEALTFALQFGAMLLAEFAGEWSRSLRHFIFS